MPTHRSIGERLKIARSPETKRIILSEWVDGWEREQAQLTLNFSLGAEICDYDAVMIAVGQLRAVTQKRFEALYGILRRFGLPDQAQDGGRVFEWGKFQASIIAIAGRTLIAKDWNELVILADRLAVSNQAFGDVKKLLTSRVESYTF